MTTELVTCEPRTTVDELARLMTDRRIRHVPVLDGDQLVGIVSIGDVVKSRLDELQTETDTLHEYLSSGADARSFLCARTVEPGPAAKSPRVGRGSRPLVRAVST
jgi:Mg/Co/Ni transporter MgtE